MAEPPFDPDQRVYPRVITKAADDQVCNICRKESELTDDHVPPRSCLLVSKKVAITGFDHRLRATPPRPALSQSGVRYRTLCGPCNSLLGADYDAALAAFAKQVHSRLTSILYMPDSSIRVQSGRVARAVLGHVLAAKAQTDNSTVDAEMRPVVLDPAATVPASVNVFYWIHPHVNVEVIREVAMPAVRGQVKGTGIFSILKFFPVGFLVANLPSYEGLPKLPLSRNLDRKIDVPYGPGLHRDADWPERVDEGNFVMGGLSLKSSLTATPTPTRGRRHRKRRCTNWP